MLLKHLRRHLVAGRPVVHIRKEGLNFSETGIVIFGAGNKERMQLVLVKIFVRKIREKKFDPFSLR